MAITIKLELQHTLVPSSYWNRDHHRSWGITNICLSCV